MSIFNTILLSLLYFCFRVEELNRLLNVCFERQNSWKESFWIVYQISCRQDCAFLDQHIIKHLFYCINKDEDFIDLKCLVPILRTCSNIIAMDNSGCSAYEFLTGLQKKGTIINNILIKNRHVNLNNECAWLLGNLFNVLKVNNLNDSRFLSINLEVICDYLLI